MVIIKIADQKIVIWEWMSQLINSNWRTIAIVTCTEKTGLPLQKLHALPSAQVWNSPDPVHDYDLRLSKLTGSHKLSLPDIDDNNYQATAADWDDWN